MRTKVIVDIEDKDGFLIITVLHDDKVSAQHTIEKKLLPVDTPDVVKSIAARCAELIPTIIRLLTS